MKFRALAVFLVSLLIAACGEVTIEAEAGVYSQLGYEPVESETEYTVKMTMLEMRETEKWAPFLSFGMLDIDNKNKLEIFLYKHLETDNGLTAGYRYIENDKIIYNIHLMNGIPLGHTINWNVSWNSEREFQIELEDFDAVNAKTNLGNIAGYVTVSGAKGKIHRY